MEINRSNYEVFFLDYFEGNLSEEQIATLMSFLEENPDLKEEFDAFELLEIKDDDSVVFKNKSFLKVPDTSLPVTESNFDWFCIAKIENDISPEQEKALDDYLKKHPEKQKDYELYAQTKLGADNDIIFEKPQVLKRHQITPFILTKQVLSYASAAAVIFIIAGLFFMLPKPTSDYETTIAESIKHSVQTTEAEAKDPDTQPLTSEPDVSDISKDPAVLPAEKSDHKKPLITKEVEYVQPVEMPAPLLASNIVLQHDVSLSPESQQHTAQVGQPSTHYTSEGYFASTKGQMSYPEENQVSLAQYAISGLQSRTNLDIDDRFGRNRISMWDIAGEGLARLSNITGTPLTVEKERNQEGRITQFALGDRFSFSRR